jgi:hypothetical protein
VQRCGGQEEQAFLESRYAGVAPETRVLVREMPARFPRRHLGAQGAQKASGYAETHDSPAIYIYIYIYIYRYV